MQFTPGCQPSVVGSLPLSAPCQVASSSISVWAAVRVSSSVNEMHMADDISQFMDQLRIGHL